MKICFLVLLLCALATAQMTVQKSNTEENLRGISAVSQSVAWASGTHGTFLRTIDGGATWEVGHVPGAESLDFRDVEAFNADDASLLAAGPGEQSRIYKTTDGGKNWTLQFTNHDPKGFFDCMAFWDHEHGIAVGDPVDGKFQLIKTENGGRDWKAVLATNLPAAIEGEGAFAASGTCIAVQGKKNVWFVTGGNAARVFRSQDAGETWSVAETPIIHGPASAGVFSVAFRDAMHGIVVGGDYKEPDKDVASVATTSDGGKTWTLAPIRPQKYFSAVAFDPANTRWTVAVGTSEYASSNDIGEHKWQTLLQAPAQLNAVSISRSRVWAVGMKGAIFVADGPKK